MLSYTTMFIASLVAVVVASLIYKVAALINKGVFDSSKHASKSNGRFAAAKGINASPGHTSQATAWNLAQMYPILPVATDKQASAWPHHMEKSASSGKSSTVKRERSQKVLRLEEVCKPFRRKVDEGIPSPKISGERAERKLSSAIPEPGPVNTPVSRRVAPVVTRKVTPKRSNANTAGKPWGW